MPFNCLVLTCLHKDHSYTEDTVKISFTTSRVFDERVLFFNIDDNPNQRSKIREFIAYPHETRYTGQICDMIVYYSRDDLSYDVICLVELKKNKAHEKEAIGQIIDTYNRIKHKFNCRYSKEIRWLAYVHYPNVGASQLNEKEKRDLLNMFDDWDCSKDNDIGNFLRRYTR